MARPVYELAHRPTILRDGGCWRKSAFLSQEFVPKRNCLSRPKVPCIQWMILGDGPFLVSQWITIPSLDDRLRDLAEVLQHKGPHEAPLKELTLGIKLLQ